QVFVAADLAAGVALFEDVERRRAAPERAHGMPRAAAEGGDHQDHHGDPEQAAGHPPPGMEKASQRSEPHPQVLRSLGRITPIAGPATDPTKALQRELRM